MSGAARGGVRGEDIAAVTHHRHEGDDPMTTAMALPGNTPRTFLVHDFGSGLEGDDRAFSRARGHGDIRPVPSVAPGAKNGARTKRIVVSRKQAEALRPAVTEIIICTGLRTRGGRQALTGALRMPRRSRTGRASLAPMPTPAEENEPCATLTSPPGESATLSATTAAPPSASRRDSAPKCGKRPPEPERSQCGPCLEKDAAAGRARAARAPHLVLNLS